MGIFSFSCGTCFVGPLSQPPLAHCSLPRFQLSFCHSIHQFPLELIADLYRIPTINQIIGTGVFATGGTLPKSLGSPGLVLFFWLVSDSRGPCHHIGPLLIKLEAQMGTLIPFAGLAVYMELSSQYVSRTWIMLPANDTPYTALHGKDCDFDMIAGFHCHWVSGVVQAML